MPNLVALPAALAALSMGYAPVRAMPVPAGISMCGGRSLPDAPARKGNGDACPGACHATCTRELRWCEDDDPDTSPE
jgi:hypothetical protein